MHMVPRYQPTSINQPGQTATPPNAKPKAGLALGVVGICRNGQSCQGPPKEAVGDPHLVGR